MKPLSLTQQRVWVLEQLHPRTAAQNVALGLRWKRQIDFAVIEGLIDHLVQRHEILRSEFHTVEGAPSRSVLALALAHLKVKAADLQQLSPPERMEKLNVLARQEAGVAFDLACGPLLRATWFRLSDQESALLLVAHRMVCDDASLRILLGEINSAFDAPLSGRADHASIQPQYSDCVSEQLTPAAQVSYWTKALASAPASIDLPTDHPRPAVQTFRGATQRMHIDAKLTDQFRAFSQNRDVSLFTTLLAAFSVLLYRYAGQEDLVVGTRVSGRERPELATVIGPLENLLALRVDVSGDPSFDALLLRVRKLVNEAFAHQDVPFEAVVRDLRLERDMSRHPLFQIVLAMSDSIDTDSTARPASMEVDGPAEQFDLSLEFSERGKELDAAFRYNPDLFDATTITRMIGHFRTLLESSANNPNTPISRLPLLTEAERHQLLVEWNDTGVSYPSYVPLHRLIEEQVEKAPDCMALVYESAQLTYRQLNQHANQLAWRLRKSGVGPDVLVAVCAERSTAMVIALLAILKAGGAYVPLDPEYPKDRSEMMLRDANPPVILAQEHLLDRLPRASSGVFCLDRDWPTLAAESEENLPAISGGKNLAYAIYTSGSTGKPKGVPNVHQGIVNRLLWMQDMYKLTVKDRVLQKTPFSFDVSVWEFFWPLLAGATLVLARPGGHRDPSYLVNLIAEQQITTLHFVPSMLNIFLESAGLERCRSVRQVFASGEALPFEVQQRFFERLGGELHNLYGPTEAAVDVTFWECRPDTRQSIVPIGKPVANTQIYILDANLEPTPIGVPGELHIGGIQLAQGYLNRPELTAEKFIRNPFSEAPGARLYKTGDLARFLPDGNIEYLGRMDFQVKMRGFRIELGEIEAVLGECAGVLQAVVTVREDHPGDKRLICYLMAEPGQELDADLLRVELRNRLPEYMVPSGFVVMDKFPMTTSGKVDRKALPAPPMDRITEITAPRTALESTLVALFARVLSLPSVGVTDNFFDLGGHSLLAGRLLAQVHEATGRQIPLSALFRGATVESLARLIEQSTESQLDSVVTQIQHGESSRLPFFAIVPPGEEALGYAMLARHMGPAQTVYKIQGHSPVTRGKRPYSEQEMRNLTSEYAAAMRSVQPRGPYCLGGFCDGTHIAEQIILKLEAEGDDVGLFAIFDTWVLQHSQRRLLWRLHYYGQRLREMKKLSVSERIASYKLVAGNKVQHLVGAKGPRLDWQQAYWPEDFTPQRFRAPVVLFKRPKQPFYYIDDPLMGWGARADGVDIHEVDFHHLEILREPQVRIFGEELAECIARLSAAPAESQNLEASLTAASPRQQGA